MGYPADLTVPWRSLGLRVAPNWFLCTDSANDDTMIVLYFCEITPRNLFMMPVCVRNVKHLSQLSDCLVAVAVAILSVVLRMLIVTISRR